jgi:signal transduction histidine kinase
VGIDSEAKDKIFDPFFTTKGPTGGTGLGLSICYSIVKDHGGTIEVESIKDRGTKFIITLPVEE